MSIPEFPRFAPLRLDHQAIFKDFVKGYAPYSDFNFTSLWSWDTEEKTQISSLNGNLVVKFLDYQTHLPFFSFLGSNNTPTTVQLLLEEAKRIGINEELKLVPEQSILNAIKLIETKYLISEDRDNFDYVFNLSEKASLHGEKYENRRKLINKFLGANKNVVTMQLKLSEHKNEIEKLFNDWARYHDGECKNDRKALERLISNEEKFSLVTLGVFKEDSLIAFLACEPLENDYALAHFTTSDLSYKGLSTYISHKMDELLFEMGHKYLNYEQDLGEPGLRKSKEMWHPSGFLKKYKICPKT